MDSNPLAKISLPFAPHPISFSRTEYDDIYSAGVARANHAKANGYYAPPVGADLHAKDNDGRAAVAEVAAARALGSDFSLVSDDGPDSGYDFSVSGYSFDCKFTHHRGGRLLFQSLTKFKADAAVLVWPGDDTLTMEVVGVIGRKKWLELVCTMTIGNRIAWVVKAEHLTPVEVARDRMLKKQNTKT